MTDTAIAIIVLGIAFAGTLAGIFLTKRAGFGRYTSSLVVLSLVLLSAAVFGAIGKLQPSDLSNILFAVAGFAGGLITSRADDP